MSGRRRVRFASQELHKLEAGVVVDEHEHVLVAADARGLERSDDVGVDEAPGIRWHVLICRVAQVSCVGFRAGGARSVATAPQRVWSISSEVGELSQPIDTYVKPSMHDRGRIVGSHAVDV